MKAHRFAIGFALALGIVACEDDPGATLAPTPPIAFVRYVHIVADTSAMDWRPVDALENSPEALNLTFRANTPYRAMGAGPRKLRIFPTSENINITSQIVIDSTITFTPNTYYTLVHIGYARPGGAPTDRIWVVEDAIPPSVPAGQIAIRVINAGIGLGAVDVASAAATTGTATTLFSNLAYQSASAYQMVPAGARALRAFAAGTTTPEIANVLMPAGAAADPTLGLTAIGGSGQAGSAITVFVVPRSVPGTNAPQCPTATPTCDLARSTLIYLIDKHPPRA